MKATKPARPAAARSTASAEQIQQLLNPAATIPAPAESASIATPVMSKRLSLKKKIKADESETKLDSAEASAATPGGAASAAAEGTVQSTEAPNLSADAGTVQSDATGSSTTASDLNAGSTPADVASADTGLSTAQLVALGALGVAAAGEVTAIAIHSNQSSNNTGTTPPQIQSLSANSASRTITLTYNEALDPNHLPLASAFNISTGGQATTVSSIAVSGNVMTLTLTALSAGALTIGYTDPTTGNDVSAIQDTSGNDASGFVQGIVADGYISGAEIFLDTNGNGIADPGESTGIFTNPDGSFFLPSTLPNVSIIAVGGINIDTGLAQTTPLKAPAGSTTINPLTTLVQAVIDHANTAGESISVADAAAQVATKLGITPPTGLSLINFDPLAGSDPNSVSAQKAAAQIATMVALTAGNDSNTASTMMHNLAQILHDGPPSTAISLSNLGSTELNTLLANTSHASDTDIHTKIQTATQTIASATDLVSISDAQSYIQQTLIDSNNNGPLLLSRIKSFASALLENDHKLSYPLLGSLDVSGLNETILNKLDSKFLEALSNNSHGSPMASSFALQSPALGWTATDLGEVFDINYSTNTFSIKFKGTYNFGDIPLADNLGFNWGADNTILKLGLNVNADMSTIWDIDFNLTGGWKKNPLSPDFDVWIDQTTINDATNTQPRTLSGSYLATSVHGTLDDASSISGNLGPLSTTADNNIDYYNTNIGNAGKSSAPATTALSGFAEVLITDSDGYNLTDLIDIKNNFKDTFDIYYGVNSQLALDVTTSLDLNKSWDSILPKFNFDLFAPLNFAFRDTTPIILSDDQKNEVTRAYNNDNNNGWVYLDNMSIEVGDLINTVISPIVEFVDPFLQAFKPLVDFLQYDLVADLSQNNGKDVLSELLQDVTDAINWLPGPDITLPTPVPTANKIASDLLINLYDGVNLTEGEVGKVRVIDLIQGIVDQMYSALPKLEPLINTTPAAKTIYDSIKSAQPYLEGTLVVLRELSDFMASYYDFADTERQLAGSAYRLNFGTLAVNITTGEVDTSLLEMPWDFNGVNDAQQSTNQTTPTTPNTLQSINLSATADTTTPPTAWQQILQIGSKIGFDAPFLSDPIQLVNLLMDKEANLLTFKPDFQSAIDGVLKEVNSDIQLVDVVDLLASIPPLSFLMPVASILDFPLKVTPNISLIPRIEAGIDNYAILNKSNPDVSFFDSLYISDVHKDQQGNLVDLPELQASIDVMLKAFLGAGVHDTFYAEAGVGFGVESDWALDLVDPNRDGKVRGAELLQLPNLAGNADFLIKVFGSLDTALGDKSSSWEVLRANMFNFDTAQPTLG